ncbi:hypothetical protein PSPO_a2052 [Pseudoalteromonas spongiae UST010723-006]|nr:hypothetical protein PSPO_a2052 [Pseudoalteromonas spongiae UST010723-006]
MLLLELSGCGGCGLGGCLGGGGGGGGTRFLSCTFDSGGFVIISTTICSWSLAARLSPPEIKNAMK